MYWEDKHNILYQAEYFKCNLYYKREDSTYLLINSNQTAKYNTFLKNPSTISVQNI